MKKTRILMTGAALALVAACAQQEEPATVTSQPVYDKYGNVVVGMETVGGVVMIDSDGDGVADTPVTPQPEPEPEPEPEPGPPNRNQNQNQNQNQGS